MTRHEWGKKKERKEKFQGTAEEEEQTKEASCNHTFVLHARSVYQTIRKLQLSSLSLNTIRSEPFISHTKSILVL
jgi:hypothetical protein